MLEKYTDTLYGRRIRPAVPEPVLWGMFALALLATAMTADSTAFASGDTWTGNVSYLSKSLRALVGVVRMVSAMLAVMMGAWVAIKWKHAGQQAQGDLINYLVMLVFMFGATLFIDAIIAVTVGKFTFLSSGGLNENESTHMRFTGI